MYMKTSVFLKEGPCKSYKQAYCYLVIHQSGKRRQLLHSNSRKGGNRKKVQKAQNNNNKKKGSGYIALLYEDYLSKNTAKSLTHISQKLTRYFQINLLIKGYNCTALSGSETKCFTMSHITLPYFTPIKDYLSPKRLLGILQTILCMDHINSLPGHTRWLPLTKTLPGSMVQLNAHRTVP